MKGYRVHHPVRARCERRCGGTCADPAAQPRRGKTPEEIRATTERDLALALGVIGLINIQYAIAAKGKLYVIEANPRASRTVPFVSKAIGVPLAKVAARLMLGEKLADQDLPEGLPEHVSVKEAVLPFARFAGADSILGPEMKSTGEVMGIAADFPTAFGKAQAAAGVVLPREGSVFITVTDTDKRPRRNWRRASTTSASRSSPPAARRWRSSGWGCRCDGSTSCTRARRTCST